MLRKLLIITILLMPHCLLADEGMWLLPFLSEERMSEMQAEGLVLSKAEIAAINQPSLKDAIVIFGQGCTGSMISSNGLLMTNHHCGFSAVSMASTPQRDILTDGFWAEDYTQEIHMPGITATFLVGIEDVTQEVLQELDGVTEPSQYEKARENIYERLLSQTLRNTDLEGEVYSFFEGAQYLLMTYKVYNDVRLVATPPKNIGRFGGETDNWNWPRHNADFMLFRVYSAPDGSPAEFSRENVPYKPSYFLPISTKGYQDGNFSMIVGYPGSTRRYITSRESEETMKIGNTIRIESRGRLLEIMGKWLQKDKGTEFYQQDLRAIASLSNYYTYSIKQNKSLVDNDIIRKKQEIERRFETWAVENDPTNRDIIALIKDLIDRREENMTAYTWFRESILQASSAISISIKNKTLHHLLKANRPQSTINAAIASLKEEIGAAMETYSIGADKELSAVAMEMYQSNVPEKYRIEVPEGFDWDEALENSIFTDKDRLWAFYENPDAGVMDKDPLYKLSTSVMDCWYMMDDIQTSFDAEYEFLMRRYIEALRKMDPSLVEYPDANFSMRLTSGKVGGYSPRDGLRYNTYTTIDGVLEKDIPGDDEFEVPETLRQLYLSKDFGRWTDQNGELRVCFLTDNDITGGNSGSPVMNGKGEIIGLAFDGNQDAMSGDITFDKVKQKTICVDIRYILFLIDKYGRAGNILQELELR